jgi:hypothetical protein
MDVNEWMSYECSDEGKCTHNIRNSSTRSHPSEGENRTSNRSKNCKCVYTLELEIERRKKNQQHSYNNCISWQKLYGVKTVERFQQHCLLCIFLVFYILYFNANLENRSLETFELYRHFVLYFCWIFRNCPWLGLINHGLSKGRWLWNSLE